MICFYSFSVVYYIFYFLITVFFLFVFFFYFSFFLLRYTKCSRIFFHSYLLFSLYHFYFLSKMYKLQNYKTIIPLSSILYVYLFSTSRTRYQVCSLSLSHWSLLFSRSSTLLFFPSLTHYHFLFCFISLRAHRLLCYSVSSIIFGSLLTLSSFTRFSLCCLHPASLILLPILTLLPPSLLLSFCPLYSHSRPSHTLYLKLYFRPSLRYHVNLYLLPTILLSFHFSRQG